MAGRLAVKQLLSRQLFDRTNFLCKTWRSASVGNWVCVHHGVRGLKSSTTTGAHPGGYFGELQSGVKDETDRWDIAWLVFPGGGCGNMSYFWPAFYTDSVYRTPEMSLLRPRILCLVPFTDSVDRTPKILRSRILWTECWELSLLRLTHSTPDLSRRHHLHPFSQKLRCEWDNIWRRVVHFTKLNNVCSNLFQNMSSGFLYCLDA
jgi:hypothetical protein